MIEEVGAMVILERPAGVTFKVAVDVKPALVVPVMVWTPTTEGVQKELPYVGGTEWIAEIGAGPIKGNSSPGVTRQGPSGEIEKVVSGVTSPSGLLKKSKPAA